MPFAAPNTLRCCPTLDYDVQDRVLYAIGQIRVWRSFYNIPPQPTAPFSQRGSIPASLAGSPEFFEKHLITQLDRGAVVDADVPIGDWILIARANPDRRFDIVRGPITDDGNNESRASGSDPKQEFVVPSKHAADILRVHSIAETGASSAGADAWNSISILFTQDHRSTAVSLSA